MVAGAAVLRLGIRHREEHPGAIRQAEAGRFPGGGRPVRRGGRPDPVLSDYGSFLT